MAAVGGTVIIEFIPDTSQMVKAMKDIEKSASGISKKMSTTNNIKNIKNIKKNIKSTNNILNNTSININKINKGVKATNTTLGKTANLFKKAFSVYAIVEFMNKAIELSSNLTEVQNVVDVTFGHMSDDLEKWSKNSIRQFGISELSVKKYSSTIGAMAKSVGFSLEDSYKLGTNLTALSADLASFYNTTNEKAYNKIVSGIMSLQARPLRDFGIDLSVANIEAFNLDRGITKLYKDMTTAEKIMSRYNYALHASKDVQGDFVRTSYSWANQVRILTENFKELMSILGTSFISILTPIIRLLNTFIEKLKIAAIYLREFVGQFVELQSPVSSNSGILDELESIEEGADAATEALKRTLGPYNELHVVGANGGTGSGGLSFDFSDYGSDIELMKTELDKLADYPFFGDIEDWKTSLKNLFAEIPAWIKAIRKEWSDAWNNDDAGNTYLKTFFDTLTDINNLIITLSQSFRTMFSSGWGEEIFGSLIEWGTLANEKVRSIANEIKTALNAGSGHYGYVQGETDPNAPKSKYAFAQTKDEGGVFRELTNGEYLAQQVYKLVDAFVDLGKAITDNVLSILEDVDWEVVIEGIATDLGTIADALTVISSIEYKDGSILTFLLKNSAKFIAFKVIASGLLKVVEVVAFIKKLNIPAIISTALKGLHAIPSMIGSLIQEFGLLKGGAMSSVLLLGIQTLIEAVWFMITGFWEGLVTRIKSGQGFGEGALWDAIFLDAPKKFAECGQTIANHIGDLLIFLGETGKDISGKIGKFFIDLFTITIPETWENFKNWIATKWNAFIESDFVQFITGLVNKIAEFFTVKIPELWNSFIDSAKQKLEELKELILNAVKWIGDKIGGIFGDNEVSISTKNKNALAFVKHSYGGAFAGGNGLFMPNNPQLITVGDNPNQKEFVMTENQMTAQIAGLMSNFTNQLLGAISGGGMNSKPIELHVHIGNDELRNFIIDTNNTENYRNGGW